MNVLRLKKICSKIQKPCLVIVCMLALLGLAEKFILTTVIWYDVKKTDHTEHAEMPPQTVEALFSVKDIPDSDTYTLKVENGTLFVFDAHGNKVYGEFRFSPDTLSPEDIKELKTHGYTVCGKAELIELLGYLES